MKTALSLLAAWVLAGCATNAAFHAAPRADVTPAPHDSKHYDPYAFLVGEWDVTPSSGGPAAAVTRFRWGPGRSYLWLSVATLAGTREEPHLEGLLMWNGATRKLDMLLALDLAGGTAQEQGTLSVEPDGLVVRDIVAIGGKGERATFRQTFRAQGRDRIATSIMRRTQTGWVPTFPNSESMVMTRRSG
jgi:hypothetical protein